MSDNKKPQKPDAEQEPAGKGYILTLTGLFTAVATMAGLIAYSEYNTHQDYLAEAEEMRKEAAYDVRILSSRDAENERGNDLTVYKLSQDFKLSVETCNDKLTTDFDLDLRLRITGEATAPDYFLFPEKWKQEKAKEDFRWTMDFANKIHLSDIESLLRGYVPSGLDGKIDKSASLEEVMTAIVQKKDESYNIKTELLDVQMAANSVDRNDYSECAFTTTVVLPVPFYAP